MGLLRHYVPRNDEWGVFLVTEGIFLVTEGNARGAMTEEGCHCERSAAISFSEWLTMKDEGLKVKDER